MKIYKGHLLYTPERTGFEVIENGYVAVKDGRIVAVSSRLSDLDTSNANLVDLGDRLLIPAMCDMHVHAPQYRNQGMCMDLELLTWLNAYTFPEEEKFADTAYAERIYRRFVRDLWRNGTMRAAVFATIHADSTRLLMHLFEEAGMGAMVGKVDMDRNCPEALCETVDEAVAANELLAAAFNDPEALVRPIITPRFIPSCTPAMLQACGRLAREYGLPVQSHLSENRAEIALVHELEPQSENYGDAYNRYGLFGQTPTLMAHCVYSTDKEIELMRRNGVMAVHCPTSNLNIASGMSPVRTLLDRGVRVSLGSDISGGHDLSMFRVMVYALQVSKMLSVTQGVQPQLTLPEVFWCATKSAGSFFGQVGSFEPGYEFDALVIDDSELNFDHYTLLERLERFIYLGDDRHIVHRYCRGQEIAEPPLRF
ncbi:MAG: amidohydrolase family protein [Muribaculaceae bacterium]|nr:amidohydrolase family protein [Muribaculaceae bacterium]